MDNRQKVKEFINNIKKEIKVLPAFEVGDIILNTWKGKKLISEVVKVILFTDYLEEEQFFYSDKTQKTYTKTNRELIGIYILKDILNEHKQSQNGIVNKYKNTCQQYISKIDSTYSKIDPKAAKILFSKD
jgi:hypothetical protein